MADTKDSESTNGTSAMKSSRPRVRPVYSYKPNGNPVRVDENSATSATGQTPAVNPSVRRQPGLSADVGHDDLALVAFAHTSQECAHWAAGCPIAVLEWGFGVLFSVDPPAVLGGFACVFGRGVAAGVGVRMYAGAPAAVPGSVEHRGKATSAACG